MLQASRCMDCGIPFCHWGCPVDNLIPEWNDLLYRGDWRSAYSRLAATNNFPEFTGRICPAPCEHSCVLSINDDAVTIRENEVAIAERAFAEGYVKPSPPQKRSGRKVAVIGGGDTGSDCVGTAIRQKALSVTQIEILPRPPEIRSINNPWPYFSKTLKTSTSQEEGCERRWSVSTLKFTGTNGRVTGAKTEEVEWVSDNGRSTFRPLPDTRRIIDADLVLLALGFIHPVTDGVISELGLELNERNNISVPYNFQVIFLSNLSLSSIIVNASDSIIRSTPQTRNLQPSRNSCSIASGEAPKIA
ncbi:MAG: FAD-dependent oxidoreductase [Bacteroidales bacterium]|nr:FAD-dependent oxidoreductase [Bacteroidales bacterium]